MDSSAEKYSRRYFGLDSVDGGERKRIPDQLEQFIGGAQEKARIMMAPQGFTSHEILLLCKMFEMQGEINALRLLVEQRQQNQGNQQRK